MRFHGLPSPTMQSDCAARVVSFAHFLHKYRGAAGFVCFCVSMSLAKHRMLKANQEKGIVILNFIKDQGILLWFREEEGQTLLLGFVIG